jgi:hypothetical protein
MEPVENEPPEEHEDRSLGLHVIDEGGIAGVHNAETTNT